MENQVTVKCDHFDFFWVDKTWAKAIKNASVIAGYDWCMYWSVTVFFFCLMSDDTTAVQMNSYKGKQISFGEKQEKPTHFEWEWWQLLQFFTFTLHYN